MNELKSEEEVHNEIDTRVKARVTHGWILMAVGSVIGFLGCVFTILDIVPAWRDIWMYGLTTLGVTIAFYGCYLVFER